MDNRRYNEACEEADEKGEPYPELNAETHDEWIEQKPNVLFFHKILPYLLLSITDNTANSRSGVP
mgnify:CR=1 FL=1